MTTLTNEAIADIYAATVRAEAQTSDETLNEATFEMEIVLDQNGGYHHVMRLVIDMLRACQRERKAMHSMEYVQGLVSKISGLEAQLAELGKQEPVAWEIKCVGDGIWRTCSKSTYEKKTSAPTYETRELYARPVPQAVSQPVAMRCDFYKVGNYPDLVRELVLHVEQLQDSAKRNVKPWEDTFPETLLPAYIERIKKADDAVRASQPYTVPDEWKYSDAVSFIRINGMCNEKREGIAMRVYNHCRAAMFPGKYRDLSQPADPQIAVYEQTMLQSAPVQPVPDSGVRAEHQRVIGLLLGVCGAAFELADDSCQQEVDCELCHVVPDNSFSCLSDWLDEIENTLPDEYENLPNKCCNGRLFRVMPYAQYSSHQRQPTLSFRFYLSVTSEASGFIRIGW